MFSIWGKKLRDSVLSLHVFRILSRASSASNEVRAESSQHRGTSWCSADTVCDRN